MSKPNDGGPFHPVALRLEHGDMAVEKLKHPGVSLRAWLAGMAMQGLWANPSPESKRGYEEDAKSACEMADALIAELEKEC